MTTPAAAPTTLVPALLALALCLVALATLLLLWAVPRPRSAYGRRPPRRVVPLRAAPVAPPLPVPVLSCAANGHCILLWAELISGQEHPPAASGA